MSLRPWAVSLLMGSAVGLPAAALAEIGLAEAAATATPSPATPTPTSASPATAAPTVTRQGWAALAGAGFYEVLHVGASYHVDERAAFEALAGYGFTRNSHNVTLGLAFAHALGSRIWTMEWGWNVKTLYWTESDPNYDWTNLSLVGGGYLVKDLDPRLSLRLDAGVAWTGALSSERKQDVNFGHPTHWNPSVCLDVVYRFGDR